LLPVAIDPVAGESLLSLVRRLAAVLGVTLARALELIGVGSAPAELRGFGVWLDEERLSAIYAATGLPPDVTRQMLLEGFDGRVFSWPRRQRSLGAWLRRLAVNDWLHVATTTVCPRCLQEEGAFRVWWKLPWAFACVRHGVLLASICPSCGGRLGASRRHACALPGFLERVPEPLACTCPVGGSYSGKRPAWCGFDLVQLPVHAVSARVRETQRVIEEAALTGQTRLGEAELPSALLFQELRALIALMRRIDWPPALIDAPQGAIGSAASSPIPRAMYRATPGEPAAMASLCVSALEIIQQPLELEEALRPLALAARRTEIVRVPRLASAYRFSARLERAWLTVSERRAGFLVELRRSSGSALGPRWLPQLFWGDLYQRFFAVLLPGVPARTGRAFVSLSLAAASGISWAEAGLALGVGGPQAKALAKNTLHAAACAQTHAQLLLALEAVLVALAGAPEPIDYGRRRRLLVPSRLLDARTWRRLCAQASVRQGQGVKRRCAQLWLWEQLTLLAPPECVQCR
jgi:TniQ